MEIIWLGHSSFRIRGRDGTVVTDPTDTSSGYRPPKVTANIVTISHDDPRHAAASTVGGEPTIVSRPGEYEISNIPIMAIRTYRDRDKGATLGKNVTYLFDIEDVTIAHLGNLGHVPTAEQIEQMGSVSVLLIPVGGRVTIDASKAIETISRIEPKIVVPMHYRTEIEKEDLDPVDRFLREMGVASPEPESKLTVTKSSLPDTMKVVVLNHPG